MSYISKEEAQLVLQTDLAECKDRLAKLICPVTRITCATQYCAAFSFGSIYSDHTGRIYINKPGCKNPVITGELDVNVSVEVYDDINTM